MKIALKPLLIVQLYSCFQKVMDTCVDVWSRGRVKSLFPETPFDGFSFLPIVLTSDQCIPFQGLCTLPLDGFMTYEEAFFSFYTKRYIYFPSLKRLFLIFHKKWISLIIQTKVPNHLHILPKPSLHGHNGNNWKFVFFDITFHFGRLKNIANGTTDPRVEWFLHES